MPWVESLSDICAKYNVTAQDTPVTRRLTALLHEDYETERRENPHDPGLFVTHVGKCEQQVYYQLAGIDPTDPLTSDSLMNFRVGHAVEEAVSELLELGGILIRETRTQIPYDDEEVRGRIDFMVWFPDSHEIWELKSIASKAMTYMLKHGEDGRPEYKQQLNLYLHASQQGLITVKVPGVHPDPSAIVLDTGKGLYTTLSPRFTKGHVVYVVKDATVDQPLFFDFEVEYDQFRAESDLMRLVKLKKDADQGIDPGIPPEYMDEFQKKKKVPFFPCAKYCQWRKKCWGDAA